MVYNSTNSAWEEVSAIGSFNINTLSSSGNTGGGSATFNGSAYRFTLSNPPQDAQQLLVSINGVIQKPNTGSSQPSEGFAVSGNDIIFSAAPASGSTSFIITLGQAVQIGTPSDGSVSTAKLTSGAVTTAKIADDAVTGDKIATNLDLPDNNKIRFGTGNDLEIFHDGTNTMIDNDTGDLKLSSSGSLRLRGDNVVVHSGNQGETMGIFHLNGAAKLYYDNVEKIQTQSYGCSVTGQIYVTHSGTTPGFSLSDNGRSGWGSQNDLQIYHTGTSSKINNATGSLLIQSDAAGFYGEGGSETMATFAKNGAVELYYDNSKKLQTNGAGVDVFQNLYLGDNVNLKLGTGADLQIYHDGSNNYIKGTGNHLIYVATNNVNRWRWMNDGHFGPEADNTYDLGSSSQRIRNIYADTTHLPDAGTVHFGVSDTAYVRGKDSTDGYIKLGTAGVDRLHINPSGLVSVPSGYIGNSLTDNFTLNGKTQPHYGLSLSAASSSPIGLSGYYGISFATQGTERVRILNTGGITFNGDTASANALDDYEEGTWDPTVTTSNGGTITVYNTIKTLSYVKIGKTVTISGRILLSSVSGSHGIIRFSLPFATSGGSTGQADYAHFMCNTHGFNLNNSTVQLFAEAGASATTMSLFQVIDNGNWIGFNSNQLNENDNEYIGFVGSYRAG